MPPTRETAMLKVISFKEVCAKTSLARASIYRKIDAENRYYYDETFPKPISLSDGKVKGKGLGGHPKPAICGHLKTGHKE